MITGRSKEKDFSDLRGQNLTTVSLHPHLERQHLTTIIQVTSYTLFIIQWVFGAQVECDAARCPWYSSAMRTAKMQRHNRFLPLKISCILPALVNIRGDVLLTSRIQQFFSTTPVDSPQYSTQKARLLLYHCLLVMNFPTHIRVCVGGNQWCWRLWRFVKNLRTRAMRRWGIWELSWTSEGVFYIHVLAKVGVT